MSSRLPAPLKPIDFHLLLALADGPLHGYALVRRIEKESEGRVRVLPGNLYAVIQRLSREGWIRESSERPEPDEDQRRRYFALSETGRSALADEARRMERMFETVRARKILEDQEQIS